MTPIAHKKSAWIPWVFIIGMLVVVGVNSLMAYIAVSTWTGIETQNAYQKGIDYNKTLAEAETQAALGWTVTNTLTPNQDQGQTPGQSKAQHVRAVYRDATGAPLTGLTVRADLIRPVHEGYDQTVTLAHTGNGVYEASLTPPLPGLWDLRLIALGPNGESHQTTTRVTVAE